MKDGTYKARIVPVAGGFNSELYLFRREGALTVNITLEDGHIVGTRVDVGEQPAKPFMVASENELRAFLSALDEVRLPLGVPEPTKEYSTGKLEATEKHLKDMRDLVFNHLPVTPKK